MNKPNGKPPNVVDMAEARRKQKTLRRQGAASGKPSSQPKSSISTKFWGAVQVILFMFVFYLGMRSCGGGGAGF